MPHFRSLACCGLFLAIASVSAVGPLPDMDTRRAYAALFERMSDRDWTVRARAERELAAKGFAALPYMRRAMASADPDIRRRLLRYLPAMEHAILVKPRRHHVSIKDKDLAGVLQAIAKTTGYKLFGNRSGDAKKFTYEFKDATFWEMLDRVCRDAGCQVQGNWGDDTVRLSPAVGVARHTGTDGSFRYAATKFQMYRSVDLAPARDDATGGRSDSLTLNFTLHAEPSLPFLGQDTPHVAQAYDDTKISMVPHGTPDENDTNPWGARLVSRRGGGGYKQLLLNVSVPLVRGGDKARLLKSIKGTVPVTLLVEQKKLVVDADILKAKGRKKVVEGVEFHIHEAKKMPNNQYQVRMTVTNKNNPGDYNWLNTFYQRVELFDAKGAKYQNYGSSWGGGGASVQLTLNFGHFGRPIGEPTSLTYTHWVTKSHDVAFEFKDLPLP